MMTSLYRSITIAAVASALIAPAAFAQGTTVKLGYINSQRLLAESPGRAEAEAIFDKEAGTARSQIQRMDDSLKSMIAAFEKDAPALDSAKREARAKVVRDQEQSFSERAQKLNQDMQQRQAELARPLMDQVSKVLDEFRVAGNYAMILDVGSQANVIVSADKNLDLTEQVLARLKQLGPPKLPAAAPAGPAPKSAVPIGPAPKPAGVSRPRG
jgi:outer membrane protein